MPDLDQTRAALLGLLNRRARRVFFDWFAEQSFAIADYAKAGPPRPVTESIRLMVQVGPVTET